MDLTHFLSSANSVFEDSKDLISVRISFLKFCRSANVTSSISMGVWFFKDTMYLWKEIQIQKVFLIGIIFFKVLLRLVEFFLLDFQPRDSSFFPNGDFLLNIRF